jgi:soluble lytic murein transglycosylase-like protein
MVRKGGLKLARRASLAWVCSIGCATMQGSSAPDEPPPPAMASTNATRDVPLPDVAAAEPAPAPAPADLPPDSPTASTLALPDVAAAGSSRGEGAGPGPGWRDEDLARIRAVQPIVHAAAREFRVDPHLVNGLIWVESKFQRTARGPAGAQGYMQIMPRTAKGVAKRLDERARPHDARWNIRAGTYILSRNLARFDGDEVLALAGYNRGTGTVLGWRERREPIPERTRAYAHRVLRAREWFLAAERAGTLEPAPHRPREVAVRSVSGPAAG